ncbi:MAG: helix-turn-helix domain-containing protein [Burkholderiales bacterium]
MNISGQVVPGGNTILRQVAASLSRAARRRLQWMDFYDRHGRNARLTCRHFGISPDVFYRWHRRYDPRRLASLEDDRRTRRPHRVRQPQTPPAIIARIRALREEYPRWGKAKLVVLLRREGIALSASTVGRVLQRLKLRGVLREPRRRRKATWHPRPHAQRIPKGYAVHAPGDLVQVDTLDVEVLPGLRRKQFTARDMISRYDVVEAYSRATAHTAAAFLDLLQQRMPFPVRALQIDGGSEFQGAFEAACAARSLPLFVVPPHSPKLQSHVERAQRTHREEFYEVWDVDPQLNAHREQLQTWAHIYNTIRPHQHLDYLTPMEFCERYAQERG